MPNKYERFVAAYLRLNGYFGIHNFVVHAGDDPGRVSSGHVGNYTECDTLGIRLPHSRESIGPKHVVNHTTLTDGSLDRVDVIIAEAKSGNENRPNKAWLTSQPDPVASYVVRFIGTHPEPAVNVVANALATTFRFEDATTRYRYVVFCNKPNEHYAARGVSYITYSEAARFIVEVRGNSWIDAGLGVLSIHQQWDEMLIDIFRIANAQGRAVDQRVSDIEAYLAN